jgi:hypothetical protein
MSLTALASNRNQVTALNIWIPFENTISSLEITSQLTMISDKIKMPQQIKMMIAAVHETRLTSINDIAVDSRSMNIIPNTLLLAGCRCHSNKYQ